MFLNRRLKIESVRMFQEFFVEAANNQIGKRSTTKNEFVGTAESWDKMYVTSEPIWIVERSQSCSSQKLFIAL